MGSQIVGLDAIDVVARRAMDEGCSSKIVPIMLYSKDQDLIENLSRGLKEITPNVFVISAGTVKNTQLDKKSLVKIKSTTKKSVENSLQTIKKNLK
jgi:hypothetical protein